MQENLSIVIPDKNNFYSLYADGLFMRKTYVRETASTVIEYEANSVIALYYTYRTRREACIVRNNSCTNGTFLPGISKKVSLLFTVYASRVDKLRRALGFLQANFGNAFSYDDGFYIRLHCLLLAKGKLNDTALRMLAEGAH